MRNEIRVAKKLCERVKTNYQDGYYVKMLSTSKFAGYRFFVSDYFFALSTTYGEITKSKNNEGYLFTLEKIDREPGKRYARPKLSFDELQAEFAEHSAQFYSDALPQALAYCKMYANNGTHTAGEVVARYFCVGGYDKSWFYEADDNRRRLNTNGVQIIKKLSADEAVQMKEKLKRLRELRRMQHDFEQCKIDYLDRYYYEVMKRTLKRETLMEITDALEKINARVDDEFAEAQHELIELEKYFDAFLPEGKGDK